MSFSLNDLTVDELRSLLFQKLKLFNEMIKENKEFDEVKKLFFEIRESEKNLQQDPRVTHDYSRERMQLQREDVKSNQNESEIMS